MKYVIVTRVKGQALKFKNRLCSELEERFNCSEDSSLPPHITIKAPFVYNNDILDVEKVIEKICEEKSFNYIVDGYGHFNDIAIYMKISLTKEAKEIHDRLIDELSEIEGIAFDKKDGKDKVFHTTLAKENVKEVFYEAWEFINNYKCTFVEKFDNICIYKRVNGRWRIHKEFNFK